MRNQLLFIVFMVLQVAAYGQAAAPAGGSWTFKNDHCGANKILRHRESTTAWDTTQSPNPKFIIDFNHHTPTAAGTYTVVQGPPKTDSEVSMGVGLKEGGVLAFYSSTGSHGKEVVTVTLSGAYIRITARNIDMAAQKDPSKHAPLTFDITIKP